MSAIGDCCVCLEPLEYDLATIPCGHTFHAKCITECMHNSGNCPTCRKSYKLHDIITLYAGSVLNKGLENDEEYRKLFHQLNQIVIKNKSSTADLLKQLDEEKQKVEEYKSKWKEELSRREEADLRAVTAEIALEETETLFKTKEREYKEQIQAKLKFLLEPIVDEFNTNFPVPSIKNVQVQSTSKIGESKSNDHGLTKKISSLKLKIKHFEGNTLLINLESISFIFGISDKQMTKCSALKQFITPASTTLVLPTSDGICLECGASILYELSKLYKKLHCINSSKDTIEKELPSKTSIKHYEIQNGTTLNIAVYKINYVIRKIANCWLIRISTHITMIYMSHNKAYYHWDKTIEAFKEIPDVDFICCNYYFVQFFTESVNWLDLYLSCRPKTILIFNISPTQIELFKSKIKSYKEASQIQDIFNFMSPGCNLWRKF